MMYSKEFVLYFCKSTVQTLSNLRQQPVFWTVFLKVNPWTGNPKPWFDLQKILRWKSKEALTYKRTNFVSGYRIRMRCKSFQGQSKGIFRNLVFQKRSAKIYERTVDFLMIFLFTGCQPETANLGSTFKRLFVGMKKSF